MEYSKWVAGWGCAETVTFQTYTDVIENETFRYEIVPTLRGSALRVHLSNLRGTKTARVARVFDRGDALHPSAAGSRRMAEVIPLEWLNA